MENVDNTKVKIDEEDEVLTDEQFLQLDKNFEDQENATFSLIKEI